MQVSKYWKPLYCLHNMTLAQSPHITWDNLSIEISPGKTCASFCRRKPNADNAVFSVPASRARSKARQRWAVWESMRVVGVSKGNTYAVAVRHPPKCWSGPSKIVEYILFGVYRQNFTAKGTTYCQSDQHCFFRSEFVDLLLHRNIHPWSVRKPLAVIINAVLKKILTRTRCASSVSDPASLLEKI